MATDRKIEERHDPVISNLPLYAQEIYWDTYYRARHKYRGLKLWFGTNAEPDNMAHYVAWEAVKREYENRDGYWQKK